MEPEDVTVWELWSVVPRGLHTVSNQAIAVWRQVLSVPVLSVFKGTRDHPETTHDLDGFGSFSALPSLAVLQEEIL